MTYKEVTPVISQMCIQILQSQHDYLVPISQNDIVPTVGLLTTYNQVFCKNYQNTPENSTKKSNISKYNFIINNFGSIEL